MKLSINSFDFNKDLSLTTSSKKTRISGALSAPSSSICSLCFSSSSFKNEGASCKSSITSSGWKSKWRWISSVFAVGEINIRLSNTLPSISLRLSRLATSVLLPEPELPTNIDLELILGITFNSANLGWLILSFRVGITLILRSIARSSCSGDA